MVEITRLKLTNVAKRTVNYFNLSNIANALFNKLSHYEWVYDSCIFKILSVLASSCLLNHSNAIILIPIVASAWEWSDINWGGMPSQSEYSQDKESENQQVKEYKYPKEYLSEYALLFVFSVCSAHLGVLTFVVILLLETILLVPKVAETYYEVYDWEDQAWDV